MSQDPDSDSKADDTTGADPASRLDQTLRDKFDDFQLPPTPALWAGIEQRLPPAGRLRRRWPLPWLLPLVMLLGVGAGWLLRGRAMPDQTRAISNQLGISQKAAAPSMGTGAAARPSGRLAAGSGLVAAPVAAGPADRSSIGSQAAGPRPERQKPVGERGRRALADRAAGTLTKATASAGLHPGLRKQAPLGAVSAPTTSGAGSPTGAVVGADSASLRDTLGAAVPAALQTLVALEQRAGAAAPKPLLAQTPSREALLAALLAERTELSRLQHRADSLLLAMGAPAAKPASGVPDTARLRPAALAHRWSLLLSATPEQNYFGLKTPAADTLNSLRRHNEAGRIGFSATLLGEYRLTNRFSLGAGLGYIRSGAELRLTERRASVSVFYTQATTDTLLITQRDTVRLRTTTIIPHVIRKDTVTYKALRPDYHFLTLPLVARYRFMPQQGRWWADVTGGVQLQSFLGGTQIVTADGRNFYTEKVGPRGGPFRPLNIGLSGSVALNYALTPRLSLSVAPGLRWQVLSVYKPETGLRQNPVVTGVQVGVRWQL